MTDQTPTNTLTDELADEAYQVWRDSFYGPDRIGMVKDSERMRFRRVVDRILAAREAHTNTARGGNADNMLRARIEALADAGERDGRGNSLDLARQLRAALDAAPAPTDNQHNNELADRVRALADKIRDGEPTAETLNGKSKAWLAGERHARHVAAFRVRAVVDGPTTPTQET